MDEEPGKCKLILFFLKIYWKSIFLVAWPVILFPIMVLSEGGKEGAKFSCLYITCIMAGYWITECIPLYVTGLIPVFMFPLLSILSSEKTCQAYFKEVNMMFLGGVLLAICIEASNLHYRIALFTIMIVGCNPKKLLFGIMMITTLMSFWLVNSACCAMMCPIIRAILDEFENQGIGSLFKPQTEEEIANGDNPKPTNSTLAFYLGIAYSSSIGGIGTLVGTTANLAYAGGVSEKFSDPNAEGMDFLPWMLHNTPIIIIIAILSWLWMIIYYLGLGRPNSAAGRWTKEAGEKQQFAYTLMKEKYQALGKMSWHESWVGALFCISMCLWLMKTPKFMKGWSDLVVAGWVKDGKFIKNSVPALLTLFFMITIPRTNTCLHCLSKDPEKRPIQSGPGLVTWKTLNEKMPWGMLFLLGGGFAIGAGGKHTGMSAWIGEQLNVLKSLPPFVVMAASTAFTSLLTEIISNTGMAVLFTPIVLEMAVVMKIHPFFIGNPMALACSSSFLLPASTIPNAIVAGLANITTIDMVKGGAVIKLIYYLVIISACPTYGLLFWKDLYSFPDWATSSVKPNVTQNIIIPQTSIFVVVWPLMMLPIIILNEGGKEGEKFRCLFVVSVMAGYWITECIPIFITGMIPIFAFPLLSILQANTTSMAYFKSANMLFLGGLLLAICIEASNLHNRLALISIMIVGCNPKKLLFGLMMCSCMLSMWLANAATTAMMCPIIKAILDEMEKQGIGSFYKPQTQQDIDNHEPPRPTKSTLAFYLGIAYASSMGGIGTLVGTPTNLAYVGQVQERFHSDTRASIDFLPWMIQFFPVSIILTILSWIWLSFLYMGLFRPKSEEGQWSRNAAEKQGIAYEIMKEKYKSLGKMNWYESWVGALFLICMLMWLTRSPKFMRGWGDITIASYIEKKLKGKFINDSVPAFFILVFMIVIPNTSKCLYCWNKDPEKRPDKEGAALVSWKVLNEKMPWGALFILGGGFALGAGSTASGLTVWIGQQLNVFKPLPPILVMACSTIFASLLTELMSNTASVIILSPIVLEMAVTMKANPLLYGNPLALACSHCFLLPAGTPANAIVSGYANIKTVDMAKAGSVIKLINYIITIVICPLVGLIFWPDMFSFPTWAEITKKTTVLTTCIPVTTAGTLTT